MLKRIQEIKSVGCFYDTTAPSVQFEHLTFIYGENCYGKSTLCDIFLSLSENISSYIVNRQSLPDHRKQQQKIQFSLSLPGQKNEYPVVFSRGSWNPPLPQELTVLVFDTNFIHRNIFTALTIERQNQENITQFIVGEEDVETAQTIAEQKSELRSLSKDIRQLERTTFEGLTDIKAFIELEVKESTEQLQNAAEAIVHELKTKNELAQGLESARLREDMNNVISPNEFNNFVSDVNECFLSSFKQSHDQSLQILQQHIKEKTRGIETTKKWLHQGLNHQKDDDCPFCGQKMQSDALALLDAYRAYFDEDLNRYVSDTKKNLERFFRQFKRFQLSNLAEVITKNALTATTYPELSSNEKFQQKIDSLTKKGFDLEILIRNWPSQYGEIERELTQKIREKEKGIYAPIPSWECPKAIDLYSKLMASAKEYNALVGRINETLKEFKSNLHPSVITKEIDELNKKRKHLSLQQRRKQSAAACTEYKQLLGKKEKIDSKSKELQEQLDKSQNKFLDTYFEETSKIFKRLGSKEFKISKQINRRGNMPVVQLVANYSGTKISNDKLHAFFSESDRRALALSVFWAKVTTLSTQEKGKTILIFDDPVTSFDDGRIDRTIRLMNLSLCEFRQAIILSHYPKYLKTFFERVREQTASGIQLLQISKDENSSQFNVATPADFIETEHHIKFKHIVDFIERKHADDVSVDLRIFLEKEVKSRYRKQISEYALGRQGFKDLLCGLHDRTLISDEVYVEIEEFRKALNPRHHKWVDSTHEDNISLAVDLLNFIYEKL